MNLKRGYITQQELERFNRYMVECEYNRNNYNKHDYQVLIDTWWNVNILKIFRTMDLYTVLIDTWWNVNFQATAQLPYR